MEIRSIFLKNPRFSIKIRKQPFSHPSKNVMFNKQYSVYQLMLFFLLFSSTFHLNRAIGVIFMIVSSLYHDHTLHHSGKSVALHSLSGLLHVHLLFCSEPSACLFTLPQWHHDLTQQSVIRDKPHAISWSIQEVLRYQSPAKNLYHRV